MKAFSKVVYQKPLRKEFSSLLRRTMQSNYCKANIHYKAMRYIVEGYTYRKPPHFALTKPQTTHS